MSIGLKVEVLGLPGRGDEIERVLVEMASKVHQHEPGCIRYDVGRLRDRPDDFLLWEMYGDEDAFDQHRITQHFEDLINGRLAELIRERVRTRFDPVA